MPKRHDSMTRFLVGCRWLFALSVGSCLIAAAAPAPEEPARPGAGDRQASTPQDPVLRAELLRRMRADQDIRGRWMKEMENRQIIAQMAEIDRENTARLKEIVHLYGWPSRALVGKEGEAAAFLLVQHADASPDFQKQCLPLIQKGASKGEIPKEAVAMLTDRVLLHEGKKQLYGTQFIRNAAGEWVPQPIEDELHVDARRKSLGLPPLAEYAKELRQFYRTSPKKQTAPVGRSGKS